MGSGARLPAPGCRSTRMNQESWDLLLSGLGVTLGLSVASILLSLLIGTFIGVLRVAPLPPLRVLTIGYIEFFRNIPLLIVLFFIYFGLPNSGLRFTSFNLPVVGWRLTNEMQAAILGLTIYHAAYVAEVVRAGLQAIPRGPFEAARALGFSYARMMWLVLLPQAFRIIIPPLGSVFIALVKNTSVASAISVFELVKQADTVESRTFNPLAFVFAGLAFLLITIPLSGLVNTVEARLQLRRRSA
jgi:putative glutamine transport system permease protein